VWCVLFRILSNNDEISSYIRETFDVNLDVFINALRLSPSAQGYIIGAISEFLLKEKLEVLGYEVKRVKEKWDRPKPLNHHGDLYVRKNNSDSWFVVESKGVKSNSEKWAGLNNYNKLRRFFIRNIDHINPYTADQIPTLIDEIFPGMSNGQTNYSIEDIVEKVKFLQTHFPSGRSGSSQREIATPLRDEFHIVSIDLFLKTRKHEFVFANSKELETSRDHPTHLQQNYFLDILIPGKKNNFTISEPWCFDFDLVFDSLENPINASEMNVDERGTILE